MGDYRFITTESLDDGAIVRIMLNRPQHHAHWAVVHEDGFPVARPEDGILGRRVASADASSGTTSVSR